MLQLLTLARQLKGGGLGPLVLRLKLAQLGLQTLPLLEQRLEPASGLLLGGAGLLELVHPRHSLEVAASRLTFQGGTPAVEVGGCAVEFPASALQRLLGQGQGALGSVHAVGGGPLGAAGPF